MGMTSPASIPNPTGHPARYSGAVVDKLRALFLADYPDWLGRPIIFDPNAGTGERLAEILAPDKNGDEVYGRGIEIQRKFIVNKKLVKYGDATQAKYYPDGEHWVAMLSVVYPNGMADGFVPSESDTSKRHTYTVANGGPLHANNMGQYGYRGTRRDGRSAKRRGYWHLADKMVECWTTNPWCMGVYLNVSDFMSRGEVEPLVDDWAALLRQWGWDTRRRYKVETPRNRGNDNAEQRVGNEVIIVATRKPLR